MERSSLRRWLTAAPLGLGIALLSFSGAQADGRTEINQAAALAGGVTATDLPGFPVTLDTAGSYVLTGSLTVTGAGDTAILISAPNTTLDLGGFEIAGPVVCTGAGTSLSCGAGAGIGIDGTGVSGLAIRNGAVRGFGSLAIRTGAFARFSELDLRGNGGGGVEGGQSCLAWSVRSDANEGDGINLGDNSGIYGSSAQRNSGSGLQGDLASVFVGNVTVDNGGDGIAGLFGGNSVHSNTAVSNADNGIRSSDGAVVTRNVLQSNLTRNLFLNASAGYAQNVVRTTVANPVTVVGGVNMGGNLCDNGACP